MPYDFEERYVEPECALSFGDNFKVEAKMLLNVDELDFAIATYVNKTIASTMETLIKNQVALSFRQTYETHSFEKIMKQVIEEKFNEKYPDVVENKANELAKKITDMAVDLRDFKGNGFQEAIRNKVNDRVDTELMEVIKKTKENIDDYAKNYFARNLFKAMNLMDSVIGTPEKLT